MRAIQGHLLTLLYCHVHIVKAILLNGWRGTRNVTHAKYATMGKNETDIAAQLLLRITTYEKEIEELQARIVNYETVLHKMKKKKLSGFSSLEIIRLLILRILHIQ